MTHKEQKFSSAKDTIEPLVDTFADSIGFVHDHIFKVVIA